MYGRGRQEVVCLLACSESYLRLAARSLSVSHSSRGDSSGRSTQDRKPLADDEQLQDDLCLRCFCTADVGLPKLVEQLLNSYARSFYMTVEDVSGGQVNHTAESLHGDGLCDQRLL